MAPMTIYYKHLTLSAFAVMGFPDDDEKARLCTAWLITRSIPDILATIQPPSVVEAII